MTQPALFEDRLPTLPGLVQGIVGMRQLPDGAPSWGRHEYDLQCSRCFEIETQDYLMLSKTRFFRCIRESGERMCPACHAMVHDEKVMCL